MDENTIYCGKGSCPNWEHQNGKQDEKHHPVTLQQKLNQHLIGEDNQQIGHTHKTQRTDGSEEVVAVGMHHEEDDEQYNPDHAIFIEAFKQAQIGRGKGRQGPFLHRIGFDLQI